LNKSKSYVGHDPRIQSMLHSVESATVELEPGTDGVIVKRDLIGIDRVLRQKLKFSLKLGVPTSGKEVSPILGVAYPATVTVIPMSNNVFNLTCRKHMICPVAVANEMSGLKGRVEVASYPQRLKVDAVISGPSFGAGHENQRSDQPCDEWINQLDPGIRDYRDQR